MGDVTEFLPYGRQVIEDDDVEAVARVMRAELLTTGPEIGHLENAFCQATGAAYAVSCNSGTAALHLAAIAVGMGPGSAAIVPSVTFLATANAVRLTGAEVVFADVEPHTGLMSPATAEDALSRASCPVKAILPVHLGGQTVHMPALAELASASGIAVIEDACHALGTTYSFNGDAVSVGSCRHSAAATFSFHPVKTIAAGEGGMVSFIDRELAEKARRFRNHGMFRDGAFKNSQLAVSPDGAINPWYYEMWEPGYNYRLSDIQAALASNQLRKLGRFAAARKSLARKYEECLAPYSGLVSPVPRTARCDAVWHLFQVLVDFERIGTDRAKVMNALRERGVGTQVHYIPVHRQPYYASRYPQLELPGADTFYSRTLSLPLFASMTEADVERVVDALIDVLKAG